MVFINASFSNCLCQFESSVAFSITALEYSISAIFLRILEVIVYSGKNITLIVAYFPQVIKLIWQPILKVIYYRTKKPAYGG
jgi:hypothetical protein